jgi:hypothetical protein
VHVADQLLRDRARSAPLAEDVVLQSSGDSDDVDSIVLIEAVVLDGDEREGQILRQRPDRNVDANLVTYLADHGSVTRQDDGRLRHRYDPRGIAGRGPLFLCSSRRWDDCQRDSERCGAEQRVSA